MLAGSLSLRLRGELSGSRCLRYAACGTAIRPCGRRAALVPPLPNTVGGDSAMNAPHATKAESNFLQMQGFLQRAGYVYSCSANQGWRADRRRVSVAL